MRRSALLLMWTLLATTTLLWATEPEEIASEERCNFAPTAKITGITDNGTYRSGVTVQLSGATSTPNNCSGSITQYRWRVNLPGEGWSTLYTGGSATYSYTFEIPSNTHQGAVKIELQVRNNASPIRYDIEEYGPHGDAPAARLPPERPPRECENECRCGRKRSWLR
jgi:hypothetical protein